MRTAPATPQKPVVHNNGHVNDETGTATVENHSFLHVWTTTQKLHNLHNRDVNHFVQQ